MVPIRCHFDLRADSLFHCNAAVMPMILQNWISQANDHWRQFTPKRYRALKTAGQLPMALRDAADRTNREMNDLQAQGFDEYQAWEMTREKYLFPPEEKPEEPVASEGKRALHEAMRNINRIRDESDE